MYNLLEYSDNYYMTSGSLQNCHRDEWNDAKEINADNYGIDNSKTIASESSEYKTKIIENTPTDNNILDTEVVVNLKNLSSFWRSFDLSLADSEIELDLSWSKDCIISQITRTVAWAANGAETTGATFQINTTKLDVPVVTLSINDNINFLENLKQGFKRTISWNKYRS